MTKDQLNEELICVALDYDLQKMAGKKKLLLTKYDSQLHGANNDNYINKMFRTNYIESI